MTKARYGFIGIGNMGGPIAANMADKGFDLIVYDSAGTESRAPKGAHMAEAVDGVWRGAETVFLCLPDGAASMAVAEQLMACEGRATGTIIDLSTIGIGASRTIHEMLARTGVVYVDSPVSGGVAGARAATITVMWAGPDDVLEAHRPILDAISGNVFHISRDAGKGQAMKLINNFLSATSLAATSEAMAFGVAEGLDLKTMLDVVNVSTGRTTASEDKFPKRILTKTYDAGFFTALLNKDVQLFLDGVREAGLTGQLGPAVGHVWNEAATDMPGSDITEIYTFMTDKLKSGS